MMKGCMHGRLDERGRGWMDDEWMIDDGWMIKGWTDDKWQ